MTRLFVFDMDGTLLPKTTAILEIGKLTGHQAELAALERQLVDRQITNETFTRHIFELWTHLSETTIKTAFKNAPKINKIKEVLERVSAEQAVSCLITSSPDFFANEFYGHGFDYIFASKSFEPAGKVFYPEHILDAKEKLVVAKKLCGDLNLDFEKTIAFGDSISDISLFESLTHTVSVNGDEHLKKYAKHHYVGSDLMEALSLVEDL